MTIAEQAEMYAEVNEIPFIEVGSDPSWPVSVDGQNTPIQSTDDCRRSVIAWLAGSGYGEVDQVVEDDGQLGTITWENGEPVSIEWDDLGFSDDE